ncbi:MAG TPA: LemA family protein [Candidatus Nanoarchaeia archaeon]|nr:LemA family protein [Candidatus Nanoarchaeia archaeon]
MKNNGNWFAKNWKWVVPVVVIFLLALWFMAAYNNLVRSEVAVDTAWGQVQSVYQRRADLIPNLVETVKGVKNFEKETYLAVTEARSKWQSATTPEQKVAAANQLESTLSKLLVTVENYPQLKSNENFLALQDELAGTENRINVERQRYNEAVGAYNQKIRVFPGTIVAKMLGFQPRAFFEANAGAENAPAVKF